MSTDEAAHGEAHVLPHTAVLYTFVMLTLGAGCKFVAHDVPIPYTAMLLLWGLLIGAIDFFLDTGPVDLSIAAWTSIDPHLFLIIFIPALIFGSAFTINFHTFRRVTGQVLLLAGPGVLIGTGLTAMVCRWMLPYAWSWNQCLLVGSILSATDPVAVVALLKELGASKRLGTVIEGESLVNDGTAYVLFLVFFAIEEGKDLDAGQVTGMFAQLALGGPALGLVFALAAVYWLGYVFDDVILEISITVIAAYLCFYVAEEFAGVSGILAVLCLGLYVAATGKDYISPKSLEEVHGFWETLEYIANTLVFVVAGTIIAHDIAMSSDSSTTGAEELLTGTDFGYLILMYLMLTLVRTLVIAILYPALKASAFPGYELSPRDCAICVWGGLRGAIGLALALIVKLSLSDNRAFTIRVIFYVGGIAAMTLLINATSMPLLLTALGMNDDGTAFRDAVERITKDMQEAAILKLEKLYAREEGNSLGDPDWERVIQLAGLDVHLFEAAGIRSDDTVEHEKRAGADIILDPGAPKVYAPSNLSTGSQQKFSEFRKTIEEDSHLGEAYCWIDPVDLANQPHETNDARRRWHMLFHMSLVKGVSEARRLLESTESHSEEFFLHKPGTKLALSALDKMGRAVQNKSRRSVDTARVDGDPEAGEKSTAPSSLGSSPTRYNTTFTDEEALTSSDEAEVLFEVRTRFLEGVKAGYHEMFEGGVVGRHAKADLHESCDVAIDHAHEPLLDWHELNAMQNSTARLSWMQQYQNLPVIGSLVRNYMLKQLAVRCETTSAFLHVHQEARVHFERNVQSLESSVKSNQVQEEGLSMAQLRIESWNTVFAESLAAEKEALDIITDIRGVFPEVVMGIKTRQIVLRLLHTKEKHLRELHAQGYIGSKEFQVINGQVSKLVKKARSRLVWFSRGVLDDEHNTVAHNGNSLRGVGPGLLRWLMSQPGMGQAVKKNSKVFVLHPGEVLFSKGAAVDGIWFITRGAVTIDLEASANDVLAQTLSRALINDLSNSHQTRTISKYLPGGLNQVEHDRLLSGGMGGLDCLLGVDKRLYTVRAATNVVAVNISLSLVNECLGSLPEFRNRLWKMSGINAARVYLLDHPRLSKLSVDELTSALSLSSYLMVPEGYQYLVRKGSVVLLVSGRGMLEAHERLVGYVKGMCVVGNVHTDIILHANKGPIELLIMPSAKEVDQDVQETMKLAPDTADDKYSLRPLLTRPRPRGMSTQNRTLSTPEHGSSHEFSGHSWGRSGNSLLPRANKTQVLRAALRLALMNPEHSGDAAEEDAGTPRDNRV